MQISQLFLLRFKLRKQRIQLITPLQLAQIFSVRRRNINGNITGMDVHTP